ncbi:MAG: T9SS type A sorting domain-containing protein [Bacteroidota bacterium]
MHQSLRILTLLVPALIAAAAGQAQTQIVSGVVGNGGGIATGDGSVVVGTLGQPAPGPSSGGGGGLVAGFWSQSFAILTDIGVPDPPLLPALHRLNQNFPNPFNPSTVIQYQLPRDAYVSLKVYDVVGRLVATLVNGVEEAGFKSVTLDGRNLASGVYFYRLQSQISGGGKNSSFVDVKKLVLMK